jgi:hypothetical protein
MVGAVAVNLFMEVLENMANMCEAFDLRAS